jgi:hypothetical protein
MLKRANRDRTHQSFGADACAKHDPCILGGQFQGPKCQDLQEGERRLQAFRDGACAKVCNRRVNCRSLHLLRRDRTNSTSRPCPPSIHARRRSTCSRRVLWSGSTRGVRQPHCRSERDQADGQAILPGEGHHREPSRWGRWPPAPRRLAQCPIGFSRSIEHPASESVSESIVVGSRSKLLVCLGHGHPVQQ